MTCNCPLPVSMISASVVFLQAVHGTCVESTHWFSCRLYMGLAWSLQKGGPGDKTDKAVAYLKEGMELLLQRNDEEALSWK